MGWKNSFTLLTALVAISCQTPPVVQQPAGIPQPPPTEVAPPSALPPEPAKLEEPKKPEAAIAPKVEDAAVEISTEQYQQTFQDVKQRIAELNAIIRAGDYSRWEKYLTPQFIASVMDPENLRQLNDQPLLRNNRIEIRTLHDFFMYVVVPSRASVRLDDLVFTDRNRVKAFMVIREDPVLIYQLEKVGETWKISVW